MIFCKLSRGLEQVEQDGSGSAQLGHSGIFFVPQEIPGFHVVDSVSAQFQSEFSWTTASANPVPTRPPRATLFQENSNGSVAPESLRNFAKPFVKCAKTNRSVCRGEQELEGGKGGPACDKRPKVV